ncbi:ABC-F family ATP-binding cassette domain-containing protein [Bacteriovorax sp. Seq25_V]|uniref:ABC-F family ATP-binding cassette domain-containing protein n=1 Tax=Bacteriovorax sp. Seq25_V TaxID=1201288 RepID=UPI00038A25AF|nr:ABC-F family ATP-binding cassette domain-containing protein [Bacteriovorax sp. Seq25_V]EQC47974.1 ABC transporter, ATP-binding protein [Bacteriovorax sp. Seq25_V]
MITVQNVSLAFGGRKLFDDVNIKFTPGNCYGLIGANGAGKSTFLKILAGDIEPNTGEVFTAPGQRISVLRQDHFAFDEYTVMDAVLMGNEKLYKIMQEKDAIYMKDPFTDEDGIRASELEADFADMNGWEAESEVGVILSGLGIGAELLQTKLKDLQADVKVKVLLASALFGSPDILLLDEPTNHLDIKAIQWLENFLLDFKNTVIVISHDRHFLNKVCTNIADIDFGKLTAYAGNYEFWKSSSELAQKLRAAENKKAEEKAQELKAFIQRFSANASKSKQATSRQKQLDRIQLDELPVSTRKYPYVDFKPNREVGKEILRVDGISKSIDGVKILDNVSFAINKDDKIVFLSENDLTQTTLFEILAGEMEPDSGTYEWGSTITTSYFPTDNSKYFDSGSLNLVDWLRQYSQNKEESFIRGFLGKMLFSGEEALKKTNVLSGGERVRCMLSKMMLSGANAIILDGPTSHLDLESITSVNDGLIRYNGGVILFTSHDHEFVQTVANRIIKIDGSIQFDKYITYDEYLDLNK